MQDEWVKSAMTDDALVAELLLRLKQTQTAEKPPVLLTFGWGIRQRRSRTSRCGGGSLRKEADSARRSPTTPLSWSGGSGSAGEHGSASPSVATVDGCDETTSVGFRSKVLATNEITSVSSKSLKRKKTFSELKDVENVLLKERLHLKNEIADLQAAFREQATRNENLKRIKLDLKDCGKNTNPEDNGNSDQPHHRKTTSFEQISSVKLRRDSFVDRRNSQSCKTDEAAASYGGFFLLPDLNMTPAEDDSVSETLYGTS